MKKLFVIVLAILSCNAANGGNDLFDFDESDFRAQMQNLNDLEEFLMVHEGLTYLDLAAHHEHLASHVMEDPFSATSWSREPAGIPSFWWGCIGGILGIIAVFLITQDEEEARRALWGCITGYLVLIGAGLTYLILLVTLIE
jgi:hypothetical protein